MAQSYKVIIYPGAEKDLQETISYLEENVGYQTALNIQNSFTQRIEELVDNPTSFSLFRADQFPNRRFRKIIVKKAWNLVFECDEEDQVVYIIRIFHVKRGTSYIKEALK